MKIKHLLLIIGYISLNIFLLPIYLHSREVGMNITILDDTYLTVYVLLFILVYLLNCSIIGGIIISMIIFIFKNKIVQNFLNKKIL